MSEQIKPTHIGWNGICPIYIADVDTDCPVIWARHWMLDPLLWLSDRIQEAYITALSLINSEWEPQFMYWGVRKI